MSIHRSQLLETVEGLFKARYESRKRGKDGKWIYTYAKKKTARASAQEASNKEAKSPTKGGDFVMRTHRSMGSKPSIQRLLNIANISTPSASAPAERVYSFKDEKTGQKMFVSSKPNKTTTALSKDPRFKYEGDLLLRNAGGREAQFIPSK